MLPISCFLISAHTSMHQTPAKHRNHCVFLCVRYFENPEITAGVKNADMRVFASVHVYVCVEHLIDGKFNSCIRPINAIKAHLLWRHSRKKLSESKAAAQKSKTKETPRKRNGRKTKEQPSCLLSPTEKEEKGKDEII